MHLPENIYLQSLIVTLIYMVIFFVISRIKDDYSIVDVGWGLGFLVISRFSLGQLGIFNLDHFVVNLLILLWSLRLSIYLYQRNKTVGEDYRYQEMRRSWGKNHQLHAFFKVFMLQGVLMWIIALPVIYVNTSLGFVINSAMQYIGIIIFSLGFFIEAIADYQMTGFKSKAKNKGRVMSQGLWKYSRHPNYFGETLVWWGIFLTVLSPNMPPFLVISPILITFLLLKVSGVTLLEEKLKSKPGYEAYVRTTSKFILWPPKKE